MGRWKIALVISLVLNLFLLGLGVGAAATGARLQPSQAAKGRPLPNIWIAAEALPPQARDGLRAALRDRAKQMQPQLRAARMVKRGALRMILAPTYDAAAVRDAFRRAREGETEVRGAVEDAFVDYVGKLSPSERTTLVQAMMLRARANRRAAAPPEPAANAVIAPPKSTPAKP